MKLSLLKIWLFLVFIVNAGFLNNLSFTYQGIASDLKSGEIYFTEEHEEFLTDAFSPDFTIIQYRNPEGMIIVKKRIDYSHHLTSPDFLQEDLRDGYMEGAMVKGDEVELRFRENYQQPILTKKIKIPSPIVIDGGFNHFLKQNWQDLTSGHSIKFYFAVPSKLDYFAFRVYKVKDETVNGKNIVLFKMEPETFVLRALSAPIFLRYDLATKKLFQYEGITTINDAKGKSLVAKIMYPVTGP